MRHSRNSGCIRECTTLSTCKQIPHPHYKSKRNAECAWPTFRMYSPIRRKVQH